MPLTDLMQDLGKQAQITQDLMRYQWNNIVKPLISDEIIAEHASNPLGKHSPHLDMVLTFLRSDPLPNQPRLVVIILEPETTWAVGEHSREKGTPIRVRPGTYDSVEAVEHAVFLERLKEVQQAYDQLRTGDESTDMAGDVADRAPEDVSGRQA